MTYLCRFVKIHGLLEEIHISVVTFRESPPVTLKRSFKVINPNQLFRMSERNTYVLASLMKTHPLIPQIVWD